MSGGGSLGSRANYGSSLSPPRSAIPRRPSTKMLVLSSKDKERILPVLWWYLVRRKVAMMIMAALALLVFIWGTFTVSKEDIADRISWITNGTGSGPPPFLPLTPPSPHILLLVNLEIPLVCCITHVIVSSCLLLLHLMVD